MRCSHQVPANEVLAVFDDSIAYLHFLLGGWGGPSHQVEWGSNLIRGLLMRFATAHKLSHQVPVNEVLAVFDDSIEKLHFGLGGWGGPATKFPSQIRVLQGRESHLTTLAAKYEKTWHRVSSWRPWGSQPPSSQHMTHRRHQVEKILSTTSYLVASMCHMLVTWWLGPPRPPTRNTLPSLFLVGG